jgi:hypothetical protein
MKPRPNDSTLRRVVAYLDSIGLRVYGSAVDLSTGEQESACMDYDPDAVVQYRQLYEMGNLCSITTTVSGLTVKVSRTYDEGRHRKKWWFRLLDHGLLCTDYQEFTRASRLYGWRPVESKSDAAPDDDIWERAREALVAKIRPERREELSEVVKP